MSGDQDSTMSNAQINRVCIGVVVLLLFCLGGGMYGCPQYNVWQKELAGKAKLREAEWRRQIKIEEAKAVLESADLLRQAEVLRAQGLSEAIVIVGEKLEANPSYIRYRWVEGLHDGTSEIIYVPTEANLPILEATRLK